MSRLSFTRTIDIQFSASGRKVKEPVQLLAGLPFDKLNIIDGGPVPLSPLSFILTTYSTASKSFGTAWTGPDPAKELVGSVEDPTTWEAELQRYYKMGQVSYTYAIWQKEMAENSDLFLRSVLLHDCHIVFGATAWLIDFYFVGNYVKVSLTFPYFSEFDLIVFVYYSSFYHASASLWSLSWGTYCIQVFLITRNLINMTFL